VLFNELPNNNIISHAKYNLAFSLLLSSHLTVLISDLILVVTLTRNLKLAITQWNSSHRLLALILRQKLNLYVELLFINYEVFCIVWIGLCDTVTAL